MQTLFRRLQQNGTATLNNTGVPGQVLSQHFEDLGRRLGRTYPGNFLTNQAPFTKTKHIFVNLGDGTFYHSGSLAIRQSIASGVNITYKVLYNDAVAMTGGQPIDGVLTVPQMTRMLEAEGARQIVIVTDEPDKYNAAIALAPGVSIRHRDELDAVQRELHKQRTTPAIARIAIALPPDPAAVVVAPVSEPITPAETEPLDPAIALDQAKQIRRNALGRMTEEYLRKKAHELSIPGAPTHGQKDKLVELILEAEYATDTLVEPEPAPEPVEEQKAQAESVADFATRPLDELRALAASKGAENAATLSRRDLLKLLK